MTKREVGTFPHPSFITALQPVDDNTPFRSVLFCHGYLPSACFYFGYLSGQLKPSVRGNGVKGMYTSHQQQVESTTKRNKEKQIYLPPKKGYVNYPILDYS